MQLAHTLELDCRVDGGKLAYMNSDFSTHAGTCAVATCAMPSHSQRILEGLAVMASRLHDDQVV